MSAAVRALAAAEAAGVSVRLKGNNLWLEAEVKPPAAVVDLLARHKAAIVGLLRPCADGWSVEDWQSFFDERAGIAEFDGGMSRVEAEARAFECCLVEWLNRNAVRSPPERCVACGGGIHPNDPLLPFGIEPKGPAWLHQRCWPAWHETRKGDAATALQAMGIPCRLLPATVVGSI